MEDLLSELDIDLKYLKNFENLLVEVDELSTLPADDLKDLIPDSGELEKLTKWIAGGRERKSKSSAKREVPKSKSAGRRSRKVSAESDDDEETQRSAPKRDRKAKSRKAKKGDSDDEDDDDEEAPRSSSKRERRKKRSALNDEDDEDDDEGASAKSSKRERRARRNNPEEDDEDTPTEVRERKPKRTKAKSKGEEADPEERRRKRMAKKKERERKKAKKRASAAAEGDASSDGEGETKRGSRSSKGRAGRAARGDEGVSEMMDFLSVEPDSDDGLPPGRTTGASSGRRSKRHNRNSRGQSPKPNAGVECVTTIEPVDHDRLVIEQRSLLDVGGFTDDSHESAWAIDELFEFQVLVKDEEEDDEDEMSDDEDASTSNWVSPKYFDDESPIFQWSDKECNRDISRDDVNSLDNLGVCCSRWVWLTPWCIDFEGKAFYYTKLDNEGWTDRSKYFDDVIHSNDRIEAVRSRRWLRVRGRTVPGSSAHVRAKKEKADDAFGLLRRFLSVLLRRIYHHQCITDAPMSNDQVVSNVKKFTEESQEFYRVWRSMSFDDTAQDMLGMGRKINSDSLAVVDSMFEKLLMMMVGMRVMMPANDTDAKLEANWSLASIEELVEDITRVKTLTEHNRYIKVALIKFMMKAISDRANETGDAPVFIAADLAERATPMSEIHEFGKEVVTTTQQGSRDDKKKAAVSQPDALASHVKRALGGTLSICVLRVEFLSMVFGDSRPRGKCQPFVEMWLRSPLADGDNDAKSGAKSTTTKDSLASDWNEGPFSFTITDDHEDVCLCIRDACSDNESHATFKLPYMEYYEMISGEEKWLNSEEGDHEISLRIRFTPRKRAACGGICQLQVIDPVPLIINIVNELERTKYSDAETTRSEKASKEKANTTMAFVSVHNEFEQWLSGYHTHRDPQFLAETIGKFLHIRVATGNLFKAWKAMQYSAKEDVQTILEDSASQLLEKIRANYPKDTIKWSKEDWNGFTGEVRSAIDDELEHYIPAMGKISGVPRPAELTIFKFVYGFAEVTHGFYGHSDTYALSDEISACISSCGQIDEQLRGSRMQHHLGEGTIKNLAKVIPDPKHQANTRLREWLESEGKRILEFVSANMKELEFSMNPDDDKSSESNRSANHGILLAQLNLVEKLGEDLVSYFETLPLRASEGQELKKYFFEQILVAVSKAIVKAVTKGVPSKRRLLKDAFSVEEEYLDEEEDESKLPKFSTFSALFDCDKKPAKKESGDGEVDPKELLLRYVCVATTYARFHEMQENMREKLVLLRKRARIQTDSIDKVSLETLEEACHSMAETFGVRLVYGDASNDEDSFAHFYHRDDEDEKRALITIDGEYFDYLFRSLGDAKDMFAANKLSDGHFELLVSSTYDVCLSALEWSLLHSGRTYRRRDGEKMRENLAVITDDLQEVADSKSQKLQLKGLYKARTVDTIFDFMKKDGKSLALMRDELLKDSEIDGLLVPAEPDDLETGRTFVLHATEHRAPKSTRGRKGAVGDEKSAPSAKECSVEAFITSDIANSGSESSDSSEEASKSRKKRPGRKKRTKGKKNQKKKKKQMAGDSDLAGVFLALGDMEDMEVVPEEDVGASGPGPGTLVKTVSEKEKEEVSERILRVLARREATNARAYAKKHKAWTPVCEIDESEMVFEEFASVVEVSVLSIVLEAAGGLMSYIGGIKVEATFDRQKKETSTTRTMSWKIEKPKKKKDGDGDSEDSDSDDESESDEDAFDVEDGAVLMFGVDDDAPNNLVLRVMQGGLFDWSAVAMTAKNSSFKEIIEELEDEDGSRVERLELLPPSGNATAEPLGTIDVEIRRI